MTEAGTRAALAQLPVSLLDLFYLRANQDTSAELVAVVSCLGGGVSAVAAPAFATLPESIRSQITTASAQLRGRFRAITARELWVASLDALDQAVESAGLNDPAFLYCRLQSVLSAGPVTVMMEPLDQPGRGTVGRIDLLAACAEALVAAFPLSDPAAASVYHLLLPLGSLHAIEQGRSVALCYPILDPAVFSNPDNSVIVLRIIYDLLSRLQQDIRAELPGHPFGDASLPVPSRQRLESDLLADGYQIQGDIAVKGSAAGRQPGDTTSFLAQLRALAQAWLAPQIQLPPQATPQLYQKLLHRLLPDVRTEEDVTMANALARLVEQRYVPTSSASVSAPRSSAGQVTTPLGPRPRIRVAPDPQPGLKPAQPSSRKNTWASDFGVSSSHRSSATVRLDRDEWLRDMRAEQSGARSSHTTPSARQGTWADDFQGSRATPQESTPDRDDWSDDFA